ncbi:MAG: Tat pathway signal protein [Gammaproteobacteria bacterium]|nr:Tat pathway signal protein [Gammaproteobacteria bacterium]MBT7795763.1 Tat pathway signal protein [Gammaproteobacteria bacterium]
MSSRRTFIKQSGVALSYILGGAHVLMTPAAAREREIALQVFSKTEVLTLEALADAIVPGAQKAGICHFLDHHLAQAAEDCLLMIKYMGLANQAYPDFYQTGIENARIHAFNQFGKSWAELNPADSAILLDEMANDRIATWKGAPASFFFFVLRSDAADLVYGTEEGFAKIGVPYAAHIAPKSSW